MKFLFDFSFGRFFAIVRKEFVQMRRDRLTFGMIIGIPLMQLILFGFAINSDPKSLPTGVLLADNGPEIRTFLTSLKNSGYFDLQSVVQSEVEGAKLLAEGRVQFIVSIPSNFTRDLHRGLRPNILIEADATDPAATSNAVGVLRSLASRAFINDFKGSLANLSGKNEAIDLRIHPLYNPEGITQYNIVPGLMGVVLTMTMVLITALAITRERERGTMENLLSMPTRPIEVMTGKIIPYIGVGYIQVCVILLAARLVFNVPFEGSLTLLLLSSLLFIIALLAVGVTFSTIARNQLQAMQMSMFFFLPSILLSGFMFPFRGMPEWAQAIGTLLPITHFIRVVRGILLKGNGISEVYLDLIPIMVFAVVVLTIGVKRYRQTLD